MQKIIKETEAKVVEIEEQLKQIAAELDLERKDLISNEENLTLHNEMLDKQQYLEEQLHELKQSLVEMTIQNLKKKKGTLTLGAEATINVNGKKKIYSIVSPINADPTKGLISVESPIGQALFGQKVGSKVTIKTPAGEHTYKILEIKNK